MLQKTPFSMSAHAFEHVFVCIKLFVVTKRLGKKSYKYLKILIPLSKAF